MKRIFPISHWLKGYSFPVFGSDLISGITLAAYAIPVSLAYAALAGLPPQYGIYGYLIGGIFYAMLGTSKQLAIGPTSSISMLIGITISGLSGGNIQRWIDLASLTAFVFSGMSILAYLLRLSSIINFISETVLLGFKAGAAIAIGITQLPKLFGVPGGGNTFPEQLRTLFLQLKNTNLAIFVIGACAMILMYLGQKWLPGKPIAIIVVIISILLVSYTPLGQTGLKTVGPISPGLPGLYLPSIPKASDLEAIIPLAFACFLLAYIESISAAKILAGKNGYEIDARQELLALGVANLATGLGHGFPISGGLSQSVVNDKAGAKTPVSLIMASATIAFCLLFLTGLIQNMPAVILAAIVLMALRGMFDYNEFIRLFRVNRFDFTVAMTALVSVIAFGILQGVVIAVIASPLLIIRIVSNPHVAFLGKIPGTERYTDMKRHPDNEMVPGALLLRVEAPLLYFNIANVNTALWNKINSSPPDLKNVIFDLSTSAYIDSSGARFIKKLYLDLRARGITLHVAEAHSEVRDILRYEEIEHLLGHVGRRDSIHAILKHSLDEAAVNKNP
jgi:SulP family sulfate permease